MPSEPVGYLITFRTYGTWLHGDERGSVDRDHRCYGGDFVPPNQAWLRESVSVLKQQTFQLDSASRDCIERTILEVCTHKTWTLHAKNARTEHVHLVVSAPLPPEPIMNSLKSWCTRRLRESGLIAADVKPWSHHGSTVYLWDNDSLNEAIRYVTESQG